MDDSAYAYLKNTSRVRVRMDMKFTVELFLMTTNRLKFLISGREK
jgi:hypothetical protein